jgi:hypothetical protein
VVDFQDPADPVMVARKMFWFQNAIPGVDYCYVQALDIEGNYLYLIDYQPFSNEDTRGLYIWDITDPVNPVFVSRFTDFQSGGYDIDASGNFVYIADMYGGLEVIDVTNKTTPVKRGYVALPDGANSVCVKSNHAVVADYINGGVQVVNVNDPDNPVVDGYYTPSGCFALGVTVEGSDIYLADGAGGFQIYNSTLVTGISDEAQKNGISGFAYPSPFSDHVSIKVEINGDPHSGLAIYDASGRLVVILNPAQVSSGSLTYEWDGRSASGKEVNAGFYYYNALSGSVSGKMVKIR